MRTRVSIGVGNYRSLEIMEDSSGVEHLCLVVTNSTGSIESITVLGLNHKSMYDSTLYALDRLKIHANE
ncbi:hypothetical protein EVB68_026 [Rhizobium phage RHph_Y2_6]|uniref:Uncharacterized protein n=1 Tax=Rhizobium phage RHph_Y2_6 TaxID=2509576 RepID=A0A7S5UT10_9CAUD|nr:hypothetical protein PP748_gp026 [Rhizobium phage RHph_Y2_6]QIG68763.1 hypothetical protein EVB68_026 [Rhizobium phage RHph_Y2_6]